ncbi:dihydrofolate reductase family protein [Alisedimentitalea sp. MJ-SS2]|uniref:dihydrofolate reductase family protein n=1 Tax=Aliisedimentitalea sp. MJ-SS2 TaxID=3049795 RepID=UPI0029084B84|nr:dihydrofolate reductase family protein [Alisedimentitalea sp. MJ-SS2]MDU8926380.1 dihydrofolate reductase family protein [Alisedimentitalea sp. MJ-SS2]
MTKRPTYVGYIAMSLDGFIATPDGSVEWLDPFNEAVATDGGDGGYGDFIAGIDALITGRTTHEQVLGWGWPYGDRANYVLTRQPGYTNDHVTAAGDIDTLKDAIAQAGHKKVWVMGGGKTQRAALDAGMFDELRVFVMPTILGGGRPLFSPGRQHNLTYVSSREHGGGMLQIDYANKD